SVSTLNTSSGVASTTNSTATANVSPSRSIETAMSLASGIWVWAGFDSVQNATAINRQRSGAGIEIPDYVGESSTFVTVADGRNKDRYLASLGPLTIDATSSLVNNLLRCIP